MDVPKEQRDLARECIRKVVHSSTEDEYNNAKEDLSDATNTSFIGYFTNNWDNYKEQWVSFLRDQYLHFANTTNNRLECHNQKLKDVTSRSMSLSEMFKNVLLFCRTNTSEYSHKSFVEEFTSLSSAYDDVPGVSEITSSCTAYAAERIIEQLNVSRKIPYSVGKENYDSTQRILVTYKDKDYHLSLSTNVCSCSFSITMGLPCCHIFSARAEVKLPVFELSMVSSRWHKDYQLPVDCVSMDQSVADGCENECSTVSISTLPPNPVMKGTLSRNQKYRKMLDIGKKLASAASEFGMPEFRKKITVVESLLHYWENNVEVQIISSQESDIKEVYNSASLSPSN